MRVIGLDPGSRITGYGVIEVLPDGSLKHIDSGNIRLLTGEFSHRMSTIYSRISGIIDEHQPDVMAIEKVFVAHNVQSALVLGHARGVAMVTAANHGLEVVEYSALQVKQAVVGRGKAAKQQVQHMVRVLLGLRVTPATDAADALACGICHLNTLHSRIQQRARVHGAMA